MSYVIAAPEAVAIASSDVSGIGGAIEGATASAAHATTRIVAAAGDEVSEAVASLFGNCARDFQARRFYRRQNGG